MDCILLDMYQQGYISVRVSNSPDISDHLLSDQCARWNGHEFPFGTATTMQCGQVMYGRYVSIQRTAPGAYPHTMVLCEVLVMRRDVTGGHPKVEA